MNPNNKVQSYLAHAKFQNELNLDDNFILKGCIQMYHAFKDEKYRNIVLSHMNQIVDEDGSLKGYDPAAYQLTDVFTGQILQFCYEESQEEKYKKARECLRTQLKKQPRLDNGNFAKTGERMGHICMMALYCSMPFYMFCETKYGKKENYNDIMAQFSNARQALEDPASEYGDCARSMYMMALVDTIEVMSQEIYEQYRMLAGMLKTAVKKAMALADRSLMGDAALAYCLAKSCRMELMLKEKYADLVMPMLEKLLSENVEDRKLLGIIIMIYAQVVRVY